MAIPLLRILAKWILQFNPFRRIIVVCQGYNDDCYDYVELVWEDDKDLDFYDKDSYLGFQLWIQ